MSALPSPSEWTLTDLTRVSNLELPLREVLRHDYGCPFGRWILLYWNAKTKGGPLWIDFEVIEGVGSVGAGSIMFYATEDREMFGPAGAMTTTDLNRAVWSVHGFVKRDGCTHVYFPTGPLHHDSHVALNGAFGAICRAQARCYEIYAETDRDGHDE